MRSVRSASTTSQTCWIDVPEGDQSEQKHTLRRPRYLVAGITIGVLLGDNTELLTALVAKLLGL